MDSDNKKKPNVSSDDEIYSGNADTRDWRDLIYVPPEGEEDLQVDINDKIINPFHDSEKWVYL